MTEQTQNPTDRSGEFIANLLQNLSKNGFPEKKVSLPLENLYESAHNKGVNFNKILTFLKEEKGIEHEKSSTRIVFFSKENSGEHPVQNTQSGTLLEQMMTLGQKMFGDKLSQDDLSKGTLDFASLSKKAAELLATMPPEQLKNLQQMVSSIPEDQKKDLMKKAKDLGIK